MKLLALVLVCLLLCSSAQALPYESYTYDYFANIMLVPAPYAPAAGITGGKLGVGKFQRPSDVFVTDGGLIFLSDTGNNRVVVFTDSLVLDGVITGYEVGGQAVAFSQPQGLYVSGSGTLYVCDTGNRRVVALARENAGWRTLFVIENPQSILLGDDFTFAPVKVAVDAAERVYVIGRNVLDGLMYFDGAQQFMGYFGTIKVSVTAANWIWRQFATQEQKKKMELFIPTEFTGLDMDGEGFIFTTEINSAADQTIKRINPAGKNVIKNYAHNNLVGDLWYADVAGITGMSEFCDIVANHSGGYSALDSKRGRVFTYDDEGRLLYVFGGLGTEFGMFGKPVAIEQRGETIYVLDQSRGMLLAFAQTTFGRAVSAAVRAQYEGDNALALESWQTVRKLCGNYEPAYDGIGKAYLTAGDNAKAVEYLQRGMDKRYYSVAMRRYRNEQVKQYFVPAVCVLGVLIAGIVIVKKVRRGGKRRA